MQTPSSCLSAAWCRANRLRSRLERLLHQVTEADEHNNRVGEPFRGSVNPFAGAKPARRDGRARDRSGTAGRNNSPGYCVPVRVIPRGVKSPGIRGRGTDRPSTGRRSQARGRARARRGPHVVDLPRGGSLVAWLCGGAFGSLCEVRFPSGTVARQSLALMTKPQPGRDRLNRQSRRVWRGHCRGYGRGRVRGARTKGRSELPSHR
jgi:hypothetical protein